MKKLLFICLVASMMTSCHESLEERAEREAREFTEKNCPTPLRDNTILDSMVFDKSTHTLTHYYTLVGVADNENKVREKEESVHQALLKDVQNNTSFRAYKDAGYSFAFIYCSLKNKGTVLYKDIIREKDYQQ